MAVLWSGEFREDWRYAFAVGRVRVLQTRLLETGRLGELANSLNAEEMVGRLAGSAYALTGETAALAEQMEAKLRHLRWAGYAEILSLSRDEALSRFMQGGEDFRNLKILLRQSLVEGSGKLELSDLGFIEPGQLRELFEAEKYEALPRAMGRAVEQAITGYYEKKNPRSIDLAVDRWALEYRRDQARQMTNEYLLGLCGLMADLGNIRSLARIKWLEEDSKLLSEAYLPGGAIELSRLQGALGVSWEMIPGMFFATAYAELVEHGFASLVADDSFVRLEKYCDDYLGEYLRATGQVVAGPEPLVAYLMGIEQEIRSVRLIFSARQAGLAAETRRERLATALVT